MLSAVKHDPNDPFEVETYQSRDQWLEARLRGIGGSDAAALWGESQYHSELSLYAEKRGQGAPDVDKEWLKLGQLLEDDIAEMYTWKSGNVTSYPGANVIYRSTRWPWMFASLDRVIHGERGYGVLECKNRSAYVISDWDEAGAPLDVQLQVQHALAVTGWQYGVIAALHGGNEFRFIEVERDEELIQLHVERCRELWNRVCSGEEPTADGSAASKAALARLHPTEEVPSVMLTPEADEWATKLEEAKGAIKGWEVVRDEMNNLLTQAIGNAKLGALPSGRFYALSRVAESVVPSYTRKAYTQLLAKKSLQERVPKKGRTK